MIVTRPPPWSCVVILLLLLHLFSGIFICNAAKEEEKQPPSPLPSSSPSPSTSALRAAAAVAAVPQHVIAPGHTHTQATEADKLQQEPSTKKLKLPFINDEEEEDEEEDLEDMVSSLTMAVAKTLGRIQGIDLAKEVYIALLSRQHPFPFCAWQVIFDPRLFTPVLLDTNSVYWLQALHFRTRNDVFRIRGRFPRVRYFSFQSYDSRGQPLTSLPDFSVRERDCGSNPFTNPCLSPANETGHFEIYITADGNHGYPNELAALRDSSLIVSTTTILYRLYGSDPSVCAVDEEEKEDGEEAEENVEDERLWGFVEVPVVEKRVLSKQETWEPLPPCKQWDLVRVIQEFITAEHTYLAPAPPKDDVCGLYNKAGRAGIVPAMFPYGHLETRGVNNYVVYTNKDSNYLYWCDSTHRLSSNFILVLRGKLPQTPAGLYTAPRIADVQSYDARYVSISTVENMAPSDTYESVYDAELEAHFAGDGEGDQKKTWDRRYTIVAAVNESVLSACGGWRPQQQQHEEQEGKKSYYFLPFARQGLTPPRLPGLVYREILARYRVNGRPDASAAYLKSVCDAGYQNCHEAGPLAELSANVMGEFYPRIEVYTCHDATRQWKRVN